MAWRLILMHGGPGGVGGGSKLQKTSCCMQHQQRQTAVSRDTVTRNSYGRPSRSSGHFLLSTVFLSFHVESTITLPCPTFSALSLFTSLQSSNLKIWQRATKEGFFKTSSSFSSYSTCCQSKFSLNLKHPLWWSGHRGKTPAGLPSPVTQGMSVGGLLDYLNGKRVSRSQQLKRIKVWWRVHKLGNTQWCLSLSPVTFHQDQNTAGGSPRPPPLFLCTQWNQVVVKTMTQFWCCCR